MIANEQWNTQNLTDIIFQKKGVWILAIHQIRILNLPTANMVADIDEIPIDTENGTKSVTATRLSEYTADKIAATDAEITEMINGVLGIV